MAFVGIEFHEKDGGGLALVRKEWITPRKTEVVWPPYKNQEKYYKALKNNETPDESTWCIYKICKQYFEVDDYDKALKKLKAAELTSDVQSGVEGEENIRPKRKHIAKKKLYDDSSDEELFERPPAIRKPKFSNNSNIIDDCDQHNLNTSQKRTPEPIFTSAVSTFRSISSINRGLDINRGIERELISTSTPIADCLTPHSTPSTSRSVSTVEFNRKTRTLTELSRWKATELRTFLLYVGPVVLKDIVDVAVNLGSQLAKKVLDVFVKHSTRIYGYEFSVYNVHMLTHLADDADFYGPLDNISCFPFENYLGQLKNLIKSPTKPLQQLCRRLTEINFSLTDGNFNNSVFEGPKFIHNSGPFPDFLFDFINYTQYKKLYFDNFILSVNSYSDCDSYCLVTESAVVQIHNVIVNLESSDILIVGRKFSSRTSLFVYPFESDQLDIYLVSNLSDQYQVWHRKDILAKCLVFPYKNTYASLPLIHSTSSTASL